MGTSTAAKKQRRLSQGLGAPTRPLTRLTAKKTMKGVEESPAPLPPPVDTSVGTFTAEVLGSLADTAAATATAATADTGPEVTADASSSQPRSYAAAAASSTTTTQSARPVITDDRDQSGSAQKASSAPQSTKRRLVMPDYEMGLSYHWVDDWALVMRPPPSQQSARGLCLL